ncbi:hypothetical protein NYE69_27195 [Paenibacillus sp. FSL R5-0527]|uniref:hypothetical protein n=1 Tax=Paenibacillus sp. FSL R5-0527 TaxID=2975321 RepID=UPI00097B17E5|nr:hypothetical protein BK140_24050 [Paenibacillus macerans]
MDARIAELKKLHVWSKPELALAIKNTEHHMKTSNLHPKTTNTIQALIMACKSYDEVIDELFVEIERLTFELTEKDATIKELQVEVKKQSDLKRETYRENAKWQDECNKLRKALEEAKAEYSKEGTDIQVLRRMIKIVDAALGEGDKE